MIERRKRLERSSFKRIGWDSYYVKLDGARSKRWREYRKSYLAGLGPNVKCHYCSLWMPKHKATLDHKNGRDGALLTDPTNIVVACSRCNFSKGSTPYDMYIDRIKKPKANES